MGRYTGPTERLSRRAGMNLFIKGERAYNGKSGLEKRPNQSPGQHGNQQNRKLSEYGVRLREKQKVKWMYGIRERQFRKYFEEASRVKGVTGSYLIVLLERRLDNVVYRLGFGGSRSDARQIVSHGHITVNGKKVNIPSYLVEAGDVVEIKETSRKLKRINESIELLARRGFPAWLELDRDNYKGVVRKFPEREDVTIPIDDQLIVEFYSRV
ncbi:MAG: 30S ribosomal protein S4 [Deltaproteobacteria bacterium]